MPRSCECVCVCVGVWVSVRVTDPAPPPLSPLAKYCCLSSISSVIIQHRDNQIAKMPKQFKLRHMTFITKIFPPPSSACEQRAVLFSASSGFTFMLKIICTLSNVQGKTWLCTNTNCQENEGIWLKTSARGPKPVGECIRGQILTTRA